MKRKLLILSVLAICLSTLAAGTLAYFTAEGKAHNVITTGGVHIALIGAFVIPFQGFVEIFFDEIAVMIT